MKIYLVQHGIALDKSEDERRPLSESGRNEVIKVASHLKRHDDLMSEVCHSRKLRAQETATIFSEAVGTKVVKEIDLISSFSPGLMGQSLLGVARAIAKHLLRK